jgi:hypothetical protein
LRVRLWVIQQTSEGLAIGFGRSLWKVEHYSEQNKGFGVMVEKEFVPDWSVVGHDAEVFVESSFDRLIVLRGKNNGGSLVLQPLPRGEVVGASPWW